MSAANLSSPLLDENQAAEVLGLKPGTLSVWRCTGRHGLPFIRVGRRIRYKLADLEAWLYTRTVESTGQADAAGI